MNDTRGWQNWVDVTCNVDNSQAGARDVYLIFHGEAPGGGAVLNLKSFVFLKSVVVATAGPVDLAGRLDKEDGEPQATHAWGMPENGFTDDFPQGMAHWKSRGFTANGQGLDPHAATEGSALAWAYTPDVYINKTDTGGDWRSLAEAALSADLLAATKESRPGIGFVSQDGEQAVCVVLNPETGALEAWRKLKDGGATLIRSHPKTAQDTRPRDRPESRLGRPARHEVPFADRLVPVLKRPDRVSRGRPGQGNHEFPHGDRSARRPPPAARFLGRPGAV